MPVEAETAQDAPAIDAPLVSIIVVSYNTREMTVACLASVYAETPDLDIELIVLDNASTDGSADAIAAAFSEVRLIEAGENLGFGRGNNRAADHARGHYLLLLNPDTLIRDRAIERLVAFAQRCPDARVWGGRTLFGDGSLNATSALGRFTPWSLFTFATGLSAMFPNSLWLNPEGIGGWARDTERQVPVITGCFLLIERAFWQRLGGFDPDFFMFAEETDLCARAEALGARPRMTPEAEIVHYGGASESVRASRIRRVLSGKVTFIDKHWSPGARWLGRTLYRFAVGYRALAYAAAARLTKRQSHAEAAAAWGDVWRHRAQWLRGYPSAKPR